MKIALVSDTYIPAPNGTSISLETLRRSLIKYGHDVWVFAPEYKALTIKEPKIVSLPGVFSLGDKYRPKIWPLKQPDPKVIKEANFDIVHSHHFYSPFKFSLDFAKSAECAHVVSFYRHFPEYESRKNSLLSSPHQKATRAMVDLANASNGVIALSKKSKQYLQELGVSAPVETCPVGIFPKDYSSYPPKAIYDKFKIPPQRKLLLYVARLEADSEFELMLRAFKLIWKAIDDVHLMIVGGGSMEKDYRELAMRQSFRDYITMTGFLPKLQVNKLYGVADLTVYPKTLDPEPLCVLESLAAGTPVVAVEASAASDFIKHNEEGLITKNDFESFADGIIELLRREKLRLEFSIRSRARAKEFRSSNLTHYLLELYESVISSKKPKIF